MTSILAAICYMLLFQHLDYISYYRCGCSGTFIASNDRHQFVMQPSNVSYAILRICEAVLDAGQHHKEVYVVRADGRTTNECDMAVAALHKRSALVLRTFSSVSQNANRTPATCTDKLPAARYTLVVAYAPTRNVILDLLYDRVTYPGTVFVLVVDHLQVAAVKGMVRNAWRNRYIFRVLIAAKGVGAQMRTIVYDAHARCGMGKFRDATDMEYELTGAYLTRTLTTLNGCPLHISMYEREQTAVRLNATAFTGQDGKLIDLLKEKMDFTPIIHLMSGSRMTYGYKRINGTNVGTFSELMNGTSDLALNGHFLKDYKCTIVSLTRQITSDRVCILTPKAGVIPPIITVFKSFQLEVWAMIVITYFIAVLTLHLWNEFGSEHTAERSLARCIVALEIFRVMVASPLSRQIRTNSQKILFAFCWFFSMVVLNSFQGSLVTFLNTPIHFPDLNTFDDLIESGLPLRTTSVSFRELLLNDRNLRQLDKKLYFSPNVSAVENFHGRFAGFQRINVYNLKYFNDIRYILENNETRLLHTMRQCLSSYFIAYAIRKDSPYKKRVDDLISGVEHAGLIIKWNEDSAKYIFDKYQLVTKDQKSTKVFSLRDLEVAFFVCICGLAISTVVLVAEIVVHGYSKRRKQILSSRESKQFYNKTLHMKL